MWAQLIFIILWAMSLGIVMVKHGQPRDNYNAWGQLLATAIEATLLYYGGFFAPFFK